MRIDFQKVKQACLGREMAILANLLPNGRKDGHEYVSLNPTRADRHLGSFRINLHTGKWADFATNDKGGDLISLWAYVHGINNGQAAMEISEIIGCNIKNLMNGVATYNNVESNSNFKNKKIITGNQEFSNFYQSEDCQPDVGQPPAWFDDIPCAEENVSHSNLCNQSEVNTDYKANNNDYIPIISVAENATPFTPKITTDYFLSLWEKSKSALHSQVETYLDERLGHCMPISATQELRYLTNHKHSDTGTYWPCMIAPITTENDQLIGVHVTFLNHEGTGKAPVNPSKKMIGNIKGGMIRLAALGEEVTISEGIETALSLQIALNKPSIAALSATNMQAVTLPPMPIGKTIYIAQDNDDAGRKAVQKLATRLWTEGRTVKILQPTDILNDFNDYFNKETNHEKHT